MFPRLVLKLLPSELSFLTFRLAALVFLGARLALLVFLDAVTKLTFLYKVNWKNEIDSLTTLHFFLRRINFTAKIILI